MTGEIGSSSISVTRCHQKDRRVQLFIVELRGKSTALGVDIEIADRAHLQNPASTVEERRERIIPERPAAIGDPRPGLEVDRIQRLQAEPAAAQATPPVADAAQGVLLNFDQIDRNPELLRDGRDLHRRRRRQPAAFDQAHAHGRAREFDGERHAGRTRASDADIAIDL
jgi:hypothetical protein